MDDLDDYTLLCLILLRATIKMQEPEPSGVEEKIKVDKTGE
jgi:hypothetical protein